MIVMIVLVTKALFVRLKMFEITKNININKEKILGGHGFKLRLGKIKDLTIGICCFSAKSKDWSAGNQNDMSVEGNIYFCILLKFLLSMSVMYMYKAGLVFMLHKHVLVLNVNLICCWILSSHP